MNRTGEAEGDKSPTSGRVTVIKRNPNSLFGLDNKLERTEFFWSHKGGIKTLQIEELSGPDYSFDHYYLNRYLHSERNIKSKVNRHLDGSVKIYLQNDYARRFNSHLPKEKKSHKKVKLWRIDGNVELENWIDFISFFYKGNEMIIEYFAPKKFEEIFELRVRDHKAWKEQQAVK